MTGFSCFFGTLLLSFAALIFTSNFSWQAEVHSVVFALGLVSWMQCVIWTNPGNGLCNMDLCHKWQYLYKVLRKCFISYIYRNIVQYCTWYNHSTRIRYNTHKVLTHAFWVRVSFPEVQSSVEVDRTVVQIARVLWVRVFKCLAQAHSNNTDRCRESDPSMRNRRFQLLRCAIEVTCIFASVNAITARFFSGWTQHARNITPLSSCASLCNSNSFNGDKRKKLNMP